jgi:DNA-binding transcriptional LysR family regulator
MAPANGTVQDISLDRLAAFLAVFDAGGFSAASERLKISKNAISRQVSTLEADLGVPLFTRNTRKVVPTAEGEELYRLCRGPINDLHGALDAVAGAKLSGEIRITAPSDFVNLGLAAALVEFARNHPGIRITLLAGDEVRDLVGERIDLAVRLGWPRDSSLRSLKIGQFELLVVAAPSYLKNVATPTHPQQLSNMDWVELSALVTPLSFHFRHRDGRTAVPRLRRTLSADTVQGVLAMVRAGGGLTVATEFSVASDLARGNLVRVLQDWKLPMGGIYLVWPRQTPEPPRLRALVEFLRAWVRRVEVGRAA